MRLALEFIGILFGVAFLTHNMNDFAKGVIGLVVVVWWINSLKNR